MMLFRLTNASTTLQCQMNKVFAKELDAFILVYFNDILIFSKVKEEHFEHICIALERLKDAKIYAQLHKCKFYKGGVSWV